MVLLACLRISSCDGCKPNVLECHFRKWKIVLNKQSFLVFICQKNIIFSISREGTLSSKPSEFLLLPLKTELIYVKGNNPHSPVYSLRLFLYRMMIPSNYKNNIVTRTSISSKHILASHFILYYALCYFKGVWIEIFRGKKCFFFEAERPFLIKLPPRSVHWRWSLQLDKGLCVT